MRFLFTWQEFRCKPLQSDAVQTALTCSTSVKCSCVVEQALMHVKRDCRHSEYHYHGLCLQHVINLIFFTSTTCQLICEVWNTKEQLASAYQLGRSETTAAMNLMMKTAPAIKVKLQELVRLRVVVIVYCWIFKVRWWFLTVVQFFDQWNSGGTQWQSGCCMTAFARGFSTRDIAAQHLKTNHGRDGSRMALDRVGSCPYCSCVWRRTGMRWQLSFANLGVLRTLILSCILYWGISQHAHDIVVNLLVNIEW